MGRMDCMQRLDKIDRMEKTVAGSPSHGCADDGPDASQNGKARRSKSRAIRTGSWIPRFWDGMCMTALVPACLVRNRFRRLAPVASAWRC